MDETKKQIVESLIAALLHDSPDSLEVGTAARGGGIKVYGSYERPEEFRLKIEKALELRAYANSQLVKEGEVK